MIISSEQLMPQRATSGEDLAGKIRKAVESRQCVCLAGSESMPAALLETPSHAMQTISILRMNKLIEHAVEDMTVIVEAGMTLEALQKQLAWRDQWLPVDPPAVNGRSPGHRTIGGLIATNSLGPLRFGCGDWRMFIMGMKWVDAAGRMIKGGGRTVKNVAGYSTPRLMIGSGGRLGAIAEVTLRSFARPADEQCLILFCRNAPQIELLLTEIMLSATTPAYIQVIGSRTFTGNPLGLPTDQSGSGGAVVVGFLGQPEVCQAQVETIRALPEARAVESIAQTAAQAGRLRLWMTSEPAFLEPHPQGLPFRIYVRSSQVAQCVAALDGAGAWVVSEAGTGVIRGMLPGAKSELIRIADGATLVRLGQPAKKNDLAARIKIAMDPNSVFGDYAK